MMNEKIEDLFRSGQYKEAEKRLREILRISPDDWQAKMLFGTCRLFQGDMETAERIHKEAEEHYAAVDDAAPEEKTFWQKYHNWIIYGTIAGSLLILAGTAFWGKNLQALFKYGGACLSETIKGQPVAAKYGGVEYVDMKEIKKSEQQSCQHKWSCIVDMHYQTCEKCGIHDISDGFSSRTPYDHIHEWISEEWTNRTYCKICGYKKSSAIPKKPKDDNIKIKPWDKTVPDLQDL